MHVCVSSNMFVFINLQTRGSVAIWTAVLSKSEDCVLLYLCDTLWFQSIYVYTCIDILVNSGSCRSIWTHIYIYIHAYVYVTVYMQKYMHILAKGLVCMYLFPHVNIYIYIYIYTYIYIYMYLHTSTFSHTYAHIYTRTYTYIHIHTRHQVFGGAWNHMCTRAWDDIVPALRSSLSTGIQVYIIYIYIYI